MKSLTILKRKTAILGLVLFCVIGFVLHTQKQQLLQTPFKVNPLNKNIIYPKTFNLINKQQEFIDYYNIYLNELTKSDRPVDFFKYKGPRSSLSNHITQQPFHKKTLNIYEAGTKPKSVNKVDVEISNYTEFDASFHQMVARFRDQLQHEDAFKELKGFFNNDLDIHFKIGEVDKHWFKFAGTSVWLQDYGVHFMISRVLYSAIGNKRKPSMSLTYAQVFDAAWNELKDTELILPITNKHKEPEFTNLKFPSFLPIPFYHNSNHQNKRYYGTEDPRLFLAKNKHGVEEPVIIFNAYHRKVNQDKELAEDQHNVNFNFYRSMFLSWPFHFQQGKGNVDGVPNSHDNVIYNEVVELRRENAARLEVQKNWTPLLSMGDRDVYGYDKYIYFVYRWSNLEILRCNLDSFVEGTSACNYEYKRKQDLSKDDVGPLRGGTEMINIRQIAGAPAMDLQDREIWVGFPRAHIKACGCGKDMYRPNLAVIVKEGDRYKLGQVSSFTSLDIEVTGWTNPNILCASRDPNALISNGISSWEFDAKENDYMTLTLSVADATNHMIVIKNLLSRLITDTSLLRYDVLGYNEDVVNSAMAESGRFCKLYGDEMRRLNKVPPPEPNY